jgi:hypothetical protein
MQAKLLLIETTRGPTSAIRCSHQAKSVRRGAISPVASAPTRTFAGLADGRERIDALAGPRR